MDYHLRLALALAAWGLSAGLSHAAEQILRPKGDGTCSSLAFSSDGKFLAAAVYSDIRLYRLSDSKELGALKGQLLQVTRLAFSSDHRSLVSAGYMPGLQSIAVKHWDLETLSERKASRIRALALCDLSADGKWLATMPRDKDEVFDVWDVATGQLEKTTFEKGAEHRMVTFSPDSKWVAVKHDNGPLRVLDWRTGKERMKFEQPRGIGGLPSFSRDGERIVWLQGEVDNSGPRPKYSSHVAVHSTTTGKQLIKLPGGHDCTGLCFTPTGGCIIVANSTSREIRFYNADQAAGVVLCKISTGELGVVKMALSPDGTRLAAAMHDGSIVVFDVPPQAVPLKKPENKEP
jgi:WD40 repeat protein